MKVKKLPCRVANPVYAAPQADLSDAPRTETGLEALHGRIGRLQWLGYCVALWLLMGLLNAGVGLVGVQQPQLKYLIWAQTALFVLLLALVSRRRLHDLGLGAPFLLGAVLPFVNLYFFFMMIFKAGDEGNNEYGQAPATGDKAAKILAYAVIGIAVFGFVAGLVLSKISR